MKLKPGARLRSQVDATEIIVVRAPADDVEVTCGGHPMIDVKDQPQPGLAAVAGFEAGTQIGKRYAIDGDSPVEFLVTKPGAHGLGVDGAPLVIKAAKPLPASD